MPRLAEQKRNELLSRTRQSLTRLAAIISNVLSLSRAPIYAILADGARPTLVSPPKPAKLLTGKPGKVVLQALLPEEDAVLQKSAYKLQTGDSETMNFCCRAI